MDDADRAQRIEESEREAALAARRSAPMEVPREINGIRSCLDCGEAIEQQRLDACPQAVRCVECQADHDHLRRL